MAKKRRKGKVTGGRAERALPRPARKPKAERPDSKDPAQLPLKPYWKF